MKYLTLTIVLLVLNVTGAAQSSPADSKARLLNAPEFHISAEDEGAGIEGTLKIAAVVTKEGDVSRAVVYVGPAWPCSEKLDDRVRNIMRDAETAVRQLKFAPATKDWKAVQSEVGVSIAIGKTAREEKEKNARPDSDKPETIKGGVINGKALSLAKPVYPMEARTIRAGGTVSVEVLIGEDGNIINAQAVEGPLVLHFAARDAACRSKFSPTLLQGNPVQLSGIMVYNFVP